MHISVECMTWADVSLATEMHASRVLFLIQKRLGPQPFRHLRGGHTSHHLLVLVKLGHDATSGSVVKACVLTELAKEAQRGKTGRVVRHEVERRDDYGPSKPGVSTFPTRHTTSLARNPIGYLPVSTQTHHVIRPNKLKLSTPSSTILAQLVCTRGSSRSTANTSRSNRMRIA